MVAIRATMAGGMTCRGGAEQLDLGGDGGEARHQREALEIVVQNSVLPPKPRSLIMESAKSKPYFSAFSVISLFRSKLGL